jgi:enterobacteria phage integrase
MHLYEPRPGYYVYRAPDGRVLPIGRVPLAHAKAEAIAANQHLADMAPSLVERLSGADHTLADVIPKMPAPAAENTVRSWRNLDKQITAALGTIPCGRLTVANCAEFLDSVREAGKERSAAALRTRLVAICKRAQQLGWMDSNPADITAAHKVKVKRGRLTLETWQAIYAKAPEVAPWLPRAMRLALVLGVDVLTLSGLQRAMVADDVLTYKRQKTGAMIAVPTAIRLDAIGVSLADILAERTGVLSPWLVHHTQAQGQARAGAAVNHQTISAAFTQARKLAGIPDEGCPTMHEQRSLCKRLYEAQGGVDTLALLGHAGEKMGALYADSRGAEPVRVKLSK